MSSNKAHEERKRRVTAADVASAAGVSQSTVSRVLNNKSTHLISQQTIEAVRAAAAELGYRPNPIARALRLQRTHLLGLIVREIADPFFAEFIDELSKQAHVLGYQVLLGHAHGDAQEGLAVTELFSDQHCDGILVLGDLRDDEAALQEMLRDHPAVVALCRGSARAAIPTINTNNSQGMRLVLDHLVGLGHRRLAFLDGGWLGDIRERRETFAAILADYNLELPDAWVQAEVNNSEGGYRAMQAVLALPERPTAVIASDDLMAIGALRAVTDAGLQVPRDISLVGFDDIIISRYLSPALTTVRQPVKEMCREALRIMLEMVNGQDVAENLVQLSPKLIVRESTGPPPAH